MREIHWPHDIREARSLQESLRKIVKIQPLNEPPRIVAGADGAFTGDMITAVVSVFTYPDLVHVEDAIVNVRTSFPYFPGFLSFKEGPGLLKAYKRLRIKPDLIIFDGHGIAHPKGIGIASHMGFILDIPAIGCAKTRLIGEYQEPGNNKGDWTYLYYNGERVGAVLRTRDNVKPVFVSPGHRIDIDSSVEIIIHCLSSFRIPQPIRRADHIARVSKTSFN